MKLTEPQHAELINPYQDLKLVLLWIRSICQDESNSILALKIIEALVNEALKEAEP